MPNNVNYISVDGLNRFLTKLTYAYEHNDSSSTKFIVNYAKEAGKATYDGAGNTITTNYLTKTDAGTTYVPLTSTVAGITLDHVVSAGDLRTALNVADDAQVNTIENIGWKQSGASTVTWITPSTVGEGQDAKQKAVVIDLSDYALKSEVASVMDYKGSKTADQLGAMTAANTDNGSVYTVSTGSSNYTQFKPEFEYVAYVHKNAQDQDVLEWVELGKNYTGIEDWCKGAFLSTTEFTAAVAGVKVAAATAADTAAALATARDITLSGDVTGTVSFDGSHDVTITTAIAAGSIVNADVNANAAIAQTKIAGSAANTTLADDIAAKANKIPAGYKDSTDGGYIATFDSNGDLASTGVLANKLSNGSVANGNTSFVTGGTVYTVTNGLDGRITALENSGYIEEVQVNGTALTETSGAVNIDISAYTDQTFTAGSTREEPIAHKAVATAIAGFANVYDDSSTPAHVDNLYEATTDDIDELF